MRSQPLLLTCSSVTWLCSCSCAPASEASRAAFAASCSQFLQSGLQRPQLVHTMQGLCSQEDAANWSLET